MNSSDNGTNFKGAKNALGELHELLSSEQLQQKVNDFTTEKGITWQFIAAQAPHFAAIWEAAVKSFEHHLIRVAGNALLTFEEQNQVRNRD